MESLERIIAMLQSRITMLGYVTWGTMTLAITMGGVAVYQSTKRKNKTD